MFCRHSGGGDTEARSVHRFGRRHMHIHLGHVDPGYLVHPRASRGFREVQVETDPGRLHVLRRFCRSRVCRDHQFHLAREVFYIRVRRAIIEYYTRNQSNIEIRTLTTYTCKVS